MKHIQRVTAMHVLPEGEPIFWEGGFKVEIVDEAAGEFVEVTGHDAESPLRICKEEWPLLRDTIEHMLKECRE